LEKKRFSTPRGYGIKKEKGYERGKVKSNLKRDIEA